MLKIDTKYLFLLLLLPCWWLFQEVEVIHWTWCRVKIIEKKTQWIENLNSRWRNPTPGYQCPPASTRSRQRTSRKSASIIVKMELMARMVIDVEDMVDPLDFVFKVEVMVKIVKLWPGWFWWWKSWLRWIWYFFRYNFQIGTLLSVFLWLRITDVRSGSFNWSFDIILKFRVIVSLAYEVPGTEQKDLHLFVDKLKR